MFYNINAQGLIAQASNVVTGTNPTYAKADFLAEYPQFTGLISDPLLTQFIGMANSVVLQARWNEQWTYAMGLFIAHFCVLFMQTAAQGSGSTAGQVLSAARAKGLQTSKGVGDLSVSYDYQVLTAGITGWAMFKSTQFGLQYVTLARMLGKAGMFVW